MRPRLKVFLCLLAGCPALILTLRHVACDTVIPQHPSIFVTWKLIYLLPAITHLLWC